MAIWDDLDGTLEGLNESLEAFDWEDVAVTCHQLAQLIAQRREAMPSQKADRLLAGLRRKRRFAEIKLIAEALLQAGKPGILVTRHYAQAAIDTGDLTAAGWILERIVGEVPGDDGEKYEAIGLLGRLKKQLYVNAAARGTSNPEHLRDSLKYYYQGYRALDEQGLWHAINVVALLMRGKRDDIDLADLGYPKAPELAHWILGVASRRNEGWDVPTKLEAHVALKNYDAAFETAAEYVSNPRYDAFEFNSTLRQLREVWGLSLDGGPGRDLIALIQSEVMKRQGGEASFTKSDLGAIRQANFSDERRVHFEWLKLAADRCASIGRVETEAGRAVGTGFLVDPRDFFDDQAGTPPLFLTNWHVISKDGKFPDSIAPSVARVRFEAAGEVKKVGAIVASNEELDACFVSLEPSNVTGICPTKPPPLTFDRQRRERVYVIGYPLGGPLSVSIHDSFWLDLDDEKTRLHYRTPTEHGSSGSPVFDQDNWRVVALHRAGGRKVSRFRGKGTYEANEGISIHAIRSAVHVNRGEVD